MYIEYTATLPSTNDRCKELLKSGIAEYPVLVVAEEQTAGRGRGGKSWRSVKGSLLMSLGLRSSRDGLPTLSLQTAQIVQKVLCKKLPETNITIHPPNDVYADGNKICGILIESPSPEFAVIGIGINVNNSVQCIGEVEQKRFALADRHITSMMDILGSETSIPLLIAEITTGMLVSV